MTTTTRARRSRAITAWVLAGALAFGFAAPAHAASDDPIAPHPSAQGTYYVDVASTNATTNTSPEANAAIGLLSTMHEYWRPEVPATPEFEADGTFLPESVGTVLRRDVLDANIAESARITQTRTPEEATAAYLYDRRNQNYSAIQGLGPWAEAFRAGTNAGTSVPDEIPADATTVKYDDQGNADGRWADTGTAYGQMVDLVDRLRGSSASTNPSKAYYNYSRPFRWSDDVLVLPTLMPAKRPDAEVLSDGGYPSGHTNAAWLASYAFAYAVPERFQEILTSASEIGNSRIVAGMHSPADVIGGRMMSTAVTAAALGQESNAEAKAAARADGELLLQTPGTGDDRYDDRGSNEELYLERLTYGLPRVGDTTLPVVVPKGAEVLLETRLPYLDADQRRWVLQSTGLGSGYALLDDAEGWGRLNLFAAADGYSAFDTDVTVEMDAAEGGFSASDTWRNDIEGDGSLTKSGTGSLVLSGANTYAGGTSVTGGTLVAASADAFGTGSLTVTEGIVSETLDAPVRIDGDVTLGSQSTLELTIDGTTPALQIGGTASFGGELVLDLADGAALAGDVVIATFADLGAGAAFDTVDIDGLPEGYTPEVRIADGAVHLTNATPAEGALTAGQPAIDGAPIAGRELVATSGDWGPAPVSLAYQWYRGAEPIDGATESRYTPGHTDVGQVLSVEVTGTKDGYTAQTRSASASGVTAASVALSAGSITAGERVAVTGAGFRPGETVDFELRSTPVAIGSAVAGPTGAFTATATVPASAAAGAHTIVATGATSGISASAPITVVAAPAEGSLAATGGSTPVLLVSIVAGVLLLLAGAALVRVRRRARHA